MDISVLVQMSKSIAHRGPDDAGYMLCSGGMEPEFFGAPESARETKELYPLISEASAKGEWRFGFSHRRFSIIDTSVAGHQPFVDLKTDNVLVFNGEIFNYLELREELETEGHGPFRTFTDTEVVLVAYRAWGTKCFERFNGFWAITIFDKSRHRLVFSRDRFGQKPLYFRRTGNALFFSSEIRGLNGFKPFETLSLNCDAAMLYLLFDRRNTFEGSLYNEINLFPAGHSGIYELDTGNWNEEPFWQYPEARWTENDIGLDDAVEGFRTRFENAVKIRMRADVPICANLSGGIDSSAIACVAQSTLGTQAQLTTNLIRYSDAPELDENEYASIVANAAGTNHEELFISALDFGNELEGIVRILEEPVHTPAFFSQFQAWRHIRNQGFRVILHGSAADELLIGYPYIRDVADLALLNRLDIGGYRKTGNCRNWRNAARLFKRMGQGELFPDLSNPVRTLAGLPDRRRVIPENDPVLFARYFKPGFLEKTEPARQKLNDYILQANEDPSSRIRADFERLRIGFWNNTMDKSMMSIPVEVRMPFLDFELVDYSMRLPTSYLYRNGWTKYILRKAVDSYVPRQVNWSRQKRGFTAPVRKWLDAFKEPMCKILAESEGELKDLVNIDAVLSDFSEMPDRLLWRIINLCIVLQREKRISD